MPTKISKGHILFYCVHKMLKYTCRGDWNYFLTFYLSIYHHCVATLAVASKIQLLGTSFGFGLYADMMIANLPISLWDAAHRPSAQRFHRTPSYKGLISELWVRLSFIKLIIVCMNVNISIQL